MTRICGYGCDRGGSGGELLLRVRVSLGGGFGPNAEASSSATGFGYLGFMAY